MSTILAQGKWQWTAPGFTLLSTSTGERFTWIFPSSTFTNPRRCFWSDQRGEVCKSIAAFGAMRQHFLTWRKMLSHKKGMEVKQWKGSISTTSRKLWFTSVPIGSLDWGCLNWPREACSDRDSHVSQAQHAIDFSPSICPFLVSGSTDASCSCQTLSVILKVSLFHSPYRMGHQSPNF